MLVMLLRRAWSLIYHSKKRRGEELCMFLSARRLSARTCMHHGINWRVLRSCMQLGIQLCVMGAARLKHICLILQMLRESTSAVSAQLSNGRGPGLTQDLQGRGFVALALEENCGLSGPGMHSTRSNWTWTRQAARVKINFNRIPEGQALDSHMSFTTIGDARNFAH